MMIRRVWSSLRHGAGPSLLRCNVVLPGSAWAIAHAVLYLSSDDANFITGMEAPVDGGITSIVGS